MMSTTPATGIVVGPAFPRERSATDGWSSPLGSNPAQGEGAVKPSQLRALITRQLAAFLAPGALRMTDVEFDDDVYYLPSRAEVEAIFHGDTLPVPGYARNVFDCDDFAYRLKLEFSLHRYLHTGQTVATPFAVGILWTRDHVMNLAVTSDACVLFLDQTPGTRGIRSPEEPFEILHVVI